MQNILDRTDTPVVVATCQHYWVIQEPAHETVVGICKNCGKERNFSGTGGEAVREKERVADMEYWSVGQLKEMASTATTEVQ